MEAKLYKLHVLFFPISLDENNFVALKIKEVVRKRISNASKMR